MIIPCGLPIWNQQNKTCLNKFFVLFHCEYNTGLVLCKHHVILQNFRSVSSDLYQCIISTDEHVSLRIESFAIINLRGVSTKLN